jgi:hypothetical protein
MNYTKEEVIKRITEQLDDCLSSHNAEVYRWEDKVLDVNLEEQTITIKLNFHVVEEDDYIGLGVY